MACGHGPGEGRLLLSAHGGRRLFRSHVVDMVVTPTRGTCALMNFRHGIVVASSIAMPDGGGGIVLIWSNTCGPDFIDQIHIYTGAQSSLVATHNAAGYRLSTSSLTKNSYRYKQLQQRCLPAPNIYTESAVGTGLVENYERPAGRCPFFLPY